jgi:choice-of-anchor B domain-containing protein
MFMRRHVAGWIVLVPLVLTSSVFGHGNVSIDSLAPVGIGGSGPFTAFNVELTDHLPLSQIGGGGANVYGNDIWGWTDPLTRREYAIVGRTNGTSFVDVTDPYNAVYLGNLPTATGNQVWRDMKVYNNHAFIVSDNNGPHGMQVFDLTRLRGVSSPQTFSMDAHANQFRNAHNIAINEDSGYAYVVGSNLANGGLLIYDIRNPSSPVLAGTYAGDGYTHDTQVINYDGPDSTYQGREIAFSSNEDTLTIVDVTNKTSPTMIRRRSYPGASYSHQGWLTEDRKYFLMDDELDESGSTPGTKTHIWSVEDLDNPIYLGFHTGTVNTIDHNQYVHGRYVYQANYTSGLRILELDDLANADLLEVGSLDTYPNSDSISFNGAWSVYPYFSSDTVIVNDIQNGLFVARFDKVRPDLNGDALIDCADVNSLVQEIVATTNYHGMDLTGDGQVNHDDLTRWLNEAGNALLGPGRNFLVGDANLDGAVDGSDFNLWNAHKFTSNAAWCRGDFNADGVVDGSDFNLWNAGKFTSSLDGNGGNLVPEPSSLVMFMILGMWSACRSKLGRRLRR